jgi:hypothetical protein
VYQRRRIIIIIIIIIIFHAVRLLRYIYFTSFSPSPPILSTGICKLFDLKKEDSV